MGKGKMFSRNPKTRTTRTILTISQTCWVTGRKSETTTSLNKHWDTDRLAKWSQGDQWWISLRTTRLPPSGEDGCVRRPWYHEGNAELKRTRRCNPNCWIFETTGRPAVAVLAPRSRHEELMAFESCFHGASCARSCQGGKEQGRPSGWCVFVSFCVFVGISNQNQVPSLEFWGTCLENWRTATHSANNVTFSKQIQEALSSHNSLCSGRTGDQKGLIKKGQFVHLEASTLRPLISAARGSFGSPE